MGQNRSIFHPVGYHAQTMDQELQRRYLQFTRIHDPLDKFLYLNQMIEENPGLFLNFATTSRPCFFNSFYQVLAVHACWLQ